MAQLRPFPFFDVELVKEDGRKGAHALEKQEMTCWASGRGQLVVGDHKGEIRVFDRGFQCQQRFPAYDGPVTHLIQLRTQNNLLSVGDDSEEPSKVKLWSMDRKEGEHPACVKTIKLFSSSYPPPQSVPLRLNLNPSVDLEYSGFSRGDEPPPPINQSSIKSSVVCADATEDLLYFAAGLTNGDIIFAKGPLRDRSIKNMTLKRPKPGSGGVSFIQFFRPRQKDVKNEYLLYVVYSDGGGVYRCTSRGDPSYEAGIEIPGCQPGCACLLESGRLAIASKDGIQYFGGSDFYACDPSGYDSPAQGVTIKKIGWFRSYIWMVYTLKNDRDQFAIYDLTNKLRGTFSNQMASKERLIREATEGYFQNIVAVVSEWGSICVVVQDAGTTTVSQKVWQIEERDTQTKLELLFKQSMYQVAIDMAKAQQFEASAVTEIHKKYGDYLYQKPDYARAVQQYIETIGNLEPSYVIRKFLDAQQIHHLTRYLEELHTRRDINDKPLANEDHTTLLLNCYTKLKAGAKLDEFIKEDRVYNPETAIKVCRQAAYYQHALHIAEKSQQHTWYLLIQIEDLKQYSQALDYIKALTLKDAEEQLREYGKVLVSKMPTAATSVLMKICTKWDILSPGDTRAASNPDYYLPCFVDSPQYLMMFLENVVKNNLELGDERGADGSTMVYNTLLELYLTHNLKQATLSDRAGEDQELDDDYEERKQKALGLLREHKGKYDREHALVLVQMHDFREGILYLYEQLGLYQDILQYYMETGDKEEVIKTCERFGQKDPNMWVQVLLHFVQLHESEDVTIETQKVLTHIDRENLLPPLVVIDILGKNNRTKLEAVKDYVVRRLEKEMAAIEQDQKNIRELQAQTQEYRDEIRSQQCEAQTFQLTKCNLCGRPLELPAVHFMCKHSFHQGCLANTDDCPMPECSSEFSRTMEMNRQLEEAVENHEQFFQQLSQKDGFSVVAEYFGRSIFNGAYPSHGLDDIPL